MSINDNVNPGKPYDISASDLDRVGKNGRPLATPPAPGRYLPLPGTDRKTYYLESDPSVTTTRRRVLNAASGASIESRTEANPLLRGRARNRPQKVVDFARQFAKDVFGIQAKPKRAPVKPLTPQEKQERVEKLPPTRPFGGVPERTTFGEITENQGNYFYGTGHNPSADELRELLLRMEADGMTIYRVIYKNPNGLGHGSTGWEALDTAYFDQMVQYLDEGYYSYSTDNGEGDYSERWGGYYVGPQNLLYLVGAIM